MAHRHNADVKPQNEPEARHFSQREPSRQYAHDIEVSHGRDGADSSAALGYMPFDADNHYYEAADAFTRHVRADMQSRVVQWVEMNGRRHHLVGGKLSRAVANPTWNPIAKPGALRDYFKGNPDGRNPLEMLRDREPLPDCYMDP